MLLPFLPFLQPPGGACDPEVPVAPYYCNPRDLASDVGFGKVLLGKLNLEIESFVSDQLSCQLLHLQAQTPFPVSSEMVLAKSKTRGPTLWQVSLPQSPE